MKIDNEVFKMKINLEIDVFDAKTNELKQKIKEHNIITNNGKDLVRDLLGMQAGITGINYFAVGIDATTELVTDTVLGDEVFRATLTDVVNTAATVNFKYFLKSSEANGNTLVEAGLFGDNATGTADTGTLFAHATHTSIAKTSAVAITYSWTISIS